MEQRSTLWLVDEQIACNVFKEVLNHKKKKYNEYTENDCFWIAKYGMENSSRRTARALQKKFPKLNEGAMCGFMKKYVKEPEHKNKDGSMLAYEFTS